MRSLWQLLCPLNRSASWLRCESSQQKTRVNLKSPRDFKVLHNIESALAAFELRHIGLRALELFGKSCLS